MPKLILKAVIGLGVLTISGLLTYRVSLSRDTTPARSVAYVIAKDIYTVDSNSRGDRQATTFGDVLMIYDQQMDGRVLFGRQNGPELQHTETTFKTSLWVLRPNGQVEELVKNDVMTAQFFPVGQDILYGTDAMDLFIRHPNGKAELVVAKALSPKISPDGKWLVYSKLNNDWQPGHFFDQAVGLMKLNVVTKEEIQLTTTWEDFDPSWSPDGATINFSSGRTSFASIWLMDADGQNQRQITNVDQAQKPADQAMTAPGQTLLWAADGRHLVYEADQVIWSITLDERRQIMKQAKRLAYGEQPVWLDHDVIGAVVAPSSGSTPKVMKIRLDGNVIQ